MQLPGNKTGDVTNKFSKHHVAFIIL